MPLSSAPPPPAASTIPELLDKHRVVLCVGAGGVGKTTLSAALGVAAAMRGRRALVLTVDPAKRLASALGIAQFDEHVQEISVQQLAALGVDAQVPLHAAMLDVKRTFDRVIRRYASSPEAAEAILRHPFYQQASTALAGSQEYMATERLFECATEGQYDVVILDTPPAEHALDFLDAPSRLVELFDSQAFRLLVRPTRRMGSGIFRSGSLVMRGLQKFTSADMFSDLLQFFGHLSETFDGFVARAREVDRLLHGADAAFVVVSGCDAVSSEQGDLLARHLRDKQLPVAAWLVNRVSPYETLPTEVPLTTDALQALLGRASAEPDLIALQDADLRDKLAHKVADAAAALAGLATVDAAAVRAIRAAWRDVPVVAVARAADEPDDLRELGRLSATLIAGGADQQRWRAS